MSTRFLTLLMALFLASGCGETAHSNEQDDSDTFLSDAAVDDNAFDDSQDAALSDEDAAIDDRDSATEQDNETSDEDTPPLTSLEPEEISEYNALIITTELLKPSFTKLAALHTMVGIPTKVVTISEICGSSCDDTDTKNDTAKKVKEYLIATPALRFVVLGGDIDDVPSRRVHDTYSNTFAGSFTSDFYTDYYFSDFSEWDTNGDGVYAEDGSDSPDFKPKVGVSRIPVSTVDEADSYIQKVESYITHYDPDAMNRVGLTANIATNYNGIVINAGYYFESPDRTVSLIPPHFTKEKLYAATVPQAAADAEKISIDSQIAMFTNGTNIIIHNGHGSPALLTCEQTGDDLDFTGDMAAELTNTVFPIFLSCACQAGQFEAPFTYHYTSGGVEKERVYTEDSPGERLVTAPAGGGIAYLGNTTTGLGLAGGSQLIDEMLRYIFTVPNPILGDALIAGHQYLKENDTFQPPLIALPIPVVDPDSYRWTQKSVVLLGDLLIPVYTTPLLQQLDSFVFDAKASDGGIAITLPQTECTISIFDTQKYYTVDKCSETSCSYHITTPSKKLFSVRKCEGYQPKTFSITVD
ncbi:hypothetical protein KAH37_03910 [bacterium]|nr:hypothetical protein [bacterium]